MRPLSAGSTTSALRASREFADVFAVAWRRHGVRSRAARRSRPAAMRWPRVAATLAAEGALTPVARRTLRGGAHVRRAAMVRARTGRSALLRRAYLGRAHQRRGPRFDRRRRCGSRVAAPTRRSIPASSTIWSAAASPRVRRVAETLVKEAWEEAGIPREVAARAAARRRRAHLARTAGRPAIGDHLRPRPVAARGFRARQPGRRGESNIGWSRFPRPRVSSGWRMGRDEVTADASLVVLDFLLRHGAIAPASPGCVRICNDCCILRRRRAAREPARRA